MKGIVKVSDYQKFMIVVTLLMTFSSDTEVYTRLNVQKIKTVVLARQENYGSESGGEMKREARFKPGTLLFIMNR